MTAAKTTTVVVLAMALGLGAAGGALAQARGKQAEDPHHPETAPQAGRSMTQGQGQGMMDPAMMRHMHEMMSQRQGMMGQGMMGQGMMGQGMMGQGMGQPGMMGPGMMGPGMGGGMDGPGRMHGLRVVPMMHLSTDDVRHFFEHHIEAHGLEHLQVGDVEQTDDEETITADIVTQEGSLAMRLSVDRHTGRVVDVE